MLEYLIFQADVYTNIKMIYHMKSINKNKVIEMNHFEISFDISTIITIYQEI